MSKLVKYIGAILLLVIVTVYLTALAPTVSFRDSGDMISASFVLGISHPSGFPLYMLLGKLLSFIPLGEVGSRYALLSLLAASFAAFFVYKTVKRLTGEWLLGLLSAVFLAFALTFWSYAEIGEKYSLYAFFASLLCYIALEIKGRAIYLYSFILGLALTHHLAIIVFALPSLYLLWTTQDRKTILRAAVFSALWFALPLLLYLYLPMRANAGTPLSWGKPDTIGKIFRHITASEYRYAMFTGESAGFPAKFYAQAVLNFIQEFTVAGYIAGLCGAVYLFFRNKKAAVFLLLALLSNILIFINYNILDPQNIGTYYFASFIIFSIWIGCGAWTLWDSGVKYGGYLKVAALGALFLVVLVNASANYKSADRSSDWRYSDYGFNLINSVESGSMLFSNGDVPMFSLWYNLYANRYNKKIDIIPITNVDIEKTIDKNYVSQKIYFNAFPYDSLNWKGYIAVPEGVVYRIYKKDGKEIKIDKNALLKKWEGYKIRGVYGEVNGKKDPIVGRLYAESHLMQGEFLAEHGFYSDALAQFEKTLEIFPDYIMSYVNMGLLAERAGNKAVAKAYYCKAFKALKATPKNDDLKYIRKELREVLFETVKRQSMKWEYGVARYYFLKSEKLK